MMTVSVDVSETVTHTTTGMLYLLSEIWLKKY